MGNNLGKLLAVGSLVVGGSFAAMMPANAVQISLSDGDVLNIGTYGAKFTGEEFTIPTGPFAGTYNSDGAVITQAEFDDNSGFATTFIAPDGFAKADINSTSISAILSNYTTNIGVVKIKSADFTDLTKFLPTTPGGPDLGFPNSNTFDVLPAFGNFIEIDDPALGDAETPDLAIRLLKFKTTQTTSLLDQNAVIGVGFEGTVEYLTFGPSGQEISLGTGSLSTTFPANGTPSVTGTAVLSFEVDKKVPESSTVTALIGFGLLGSAFALKKKVRLG